eukprot:COSAG03_NODE_13306_length_508_cov_0.757946_1_plen_47_part_10
MTHIPATESTFCLVERSLMLWSVLLESIRRPNEGNGAGGGDTTADGS